VEDKRTPSTIDLVLANTPRLATRPRTIEGGPSDHLPVYLEIGATVARQSEQRVPVWDYRRADWKTFNKFLLDNTPRTKPTLRDEADIDTAINAVTTLIQEAGNISIPTSTGIKKEQALPSSILKLIKEKNTSRGKWQKTRSVDDRKRYNWLHRQVKLEIRQWLQDSWHNKLTSVSTTDGSLWKLCKALSRKSSNNIPPLTRPDRNRGKATNNRDKAELIRDHFVSIHKTAASRGNKSHTELIESKVDKILSLTTPTTGSTIKPTNRKEVSELIKSLKQNKSPGQDLITNRFLKHLPKPTIKYITTIINAVLRRSYYPTAWKTARVIPIPKPNKNTFCSI
jgi:hypothetical protein